MNLSPGGALLEAPFQLRPGSQHNLDLLSSGKTLTVPLQLLRCYVTELKEGLRYHAACAFHQTLKLATPLDGVLTHLESRRLLRVLESFQQTSLASDVSSHGTRFSELLAWVVAASRRDEPSTLISTRIEAHLRRLFPSLIICAKSPSPPPNPSTTSQFFDLEFRSSAPLSSSDRRFLRASAQLMSFLSKPTGSQGVEMEAVDDAQSSSFPSEIPSSEIARTATEWLEMCRSDGAGSKSVDPAHKDFWKAVTLTSR